MNKKNKTFRSIQQQIFILGITLVIIKMVGRLNLCWLATLSPLILIAVFQIVIFLLIITTYTINKYYEHKDNRNR